MELEGVERPGAARAGRREEEHRAENWSLLRTKFSSLLAALIPVPCQVVRTSRRIMCRLLSWNPWQVVFLRLVERLHVGRLR